MPIRPIQPTRPTRPTPAAHTRVPNPFWSHLAEQRQTDKERQWQRADMVVWDAVAASEAEEKNPRRRFMPRIAELEKLTPFAMVLTNYMWNKRPANQRPLNPTQLAVRLGVPRQSVNNWIYKGNVPPIEGILAILAQLDIPLRELYDAYRNAGITVPRWDDSETGKPTIANTVAKRSRKQTTIPITAEADSTTTDTSDDDAPTPRPYTPPRTYNPADEEAADWQRLAEQTAAAMREEGAPQAMIDAVIAHIRAQQTGSHSIQHNVIAEHAESPATTSGTPDTSDTPNKPTSSHRPQG